MWTKERVLLAEPVHALAYRAVEQIVAGGGEAVVVGSVADAKRTRGTFDRGVFAFDLPDGSGIVLAAELMLENRIRRAEFFHPREELSARRERPSGVRATSCPPDGAAPARGVA